MTLPRCYNNSERTLFFNNKKPTKSTLKTKLTVKPKSINITEELTLPPTRLPNPPKKSKPYPERSLNSLKTSPTRRSNLISLTNKKLNSPNKEKKMLKPSDNSITKPNKSLMPLMLSSPN